MFEVIPVLPVAKACEWCEPQKCYAASVWWGHVLLAFYTTDRQRLAPAELNDAACDVLRELTKAMRPGSDSIISAEELADEVGSPFLLGCFWEDFKPAVAMAWRSWARIPLPVAP